MNSKPTILFGMEKRGRARWIREIFNLASKGKTKDSLKIMEGVLANRLPTKTTAHPSASGNSVLGSLFASHLPQVDAALELGSLTPKHIKRLHDLLRSDLRSVAEDVPVSPPSIQKVLNMVKRDLEGETFSISKKELHNLVRERYGIAPHRKVISDTGEPMALFQNLGSEKLQKNWLTTNMTGASAVRPGQEPGLWLAGLPSPSQTSRLEAVSTLTPEISRYAGHASQFGDRPSILLGRLKNPSAFVNHTAAASPGTLVNNQFFVGDSMKDAIVDAKIFRLPLRMVDHLMPAGAMRSDSEIAKNLGKIKDKYTKRFFHPRYGYTRQPQSAVFGPNEIRRFYNSPNNLKFDDEVRNYLLYLESKTK